MLVSSALREVDFWVAELDFDVSVAGNVTDALSRVQEDARPEEATYSAGPEIPRCYAIIWRANRAGGNPTYRVKAMVNVLAEL